MAGGRPSKYDPKMIEQARKLCELGATDREVADFFEISESTLNLWKGLHPEFSESLKVGKTAADERVIQSLYRRATGYVHDAVKIAVNSQGEVTQVPFVEHYPPDTTAAIFWLKNRRKEEWRDRVDHEHAGRDGGVIQTKVDVTGLSVEQLRALSSIRVSGE
jgi:hypothetical protein